MNRSNHAVCRPLQCSSVPFAHHSVAVAVVGADDVRGVSGAVVAQERLQVHRLAVHRQALCDQVRRQKSFRRGQHDIEVEVGGTKQWEEW